MRGVRDLVAPDGAYEAAPQVSLFGASHAVTPRVLGTKRAKLRFFGFRNSPRVTVAWIKLRTRVCRRAIDEVACSNRDRRQIQINSCCTACLGTLAIVIAVW